MEIPFGILLDERLIRDRCENMSSQGQYEKLFSYLRQNPNIGLITRMSKDNIEKEYNKKKDKQLIYELDEVLECFVKVENIEYQTYLENLKVVSDTFSTMLRRKPNANSFPKNKYVGVVRSARSSVGQWARSANRIYLNQQDFKGLAEAVSVRPDYSRLLFASNNDALSNPFVLNSMEEKFDVVCGDPKLIMSEIKKTFI
jgi:hypothetical protein